MRLTDKSKEKRLRAKANCTEEEQIYLKLAQLENEFESKTLFTKNQLNLAIKNGLEMMADIIKVRATEGILLTLLNEIKDKVVDGKVEYKLIEKTAKEIIKEIAKTR